MRIKLPTNQFLSFVIIFLYQIIDSYSQYLNSSIFTINQGVPPHLYKFQILSGRYINGNLLCTSGSVDLDAYLYQEGRNLMLNNGYTTRYISSTLCAQSVNFIPPSPGNYYLKVYPYLSSPHTQFFSYQFNFVSSTATTNYSTIGDSIDSNNHLYSTYIFNRKQQQSCIDYLIIYTSPPGIQTKILIQSQNSPNRSLIQFDSSGGTYEQVITNISDIGDWTVKVLYNTSANFYNVTPYTVQLYKIATDQGVCQQSCISLNMQWNRAALACKKVFNQANYTSPQNSTITTTSSSLKTGQIIGISVAAAVIIFLIVLAFFLYKRYKQKQSAISNTNLEITEQQLNKADYMEEDCAICLQKNCNSMLSCGHLFHMKCVTQWLKKNKSCPFCRHQANKQSIRIIKKTQTRKIRASQSVDPLQAPL